MELSIVSYDRCDGNLLDGFRRIYMASFPDEDEREPYEEIIRRISSQTSAPGTIACVLTEDGKVLGGLVSDYYAFPESGALDVEAIYVAVDPSARRNGYGRALLDKGMSLTVSEAERLSGMKLRNIYFETENPFDVKVESFNPVSRLRFFTALGAVRVPIDYRQPPLSGETDWAENMFLMVLPSPGKQSPEYVYSKDLKEFLTAFYHGLSVADNAAYDRFRKEIDTISEVEKDSRKCSRIVRLDSFKEMPSYSIEDVSVLLHYRMKDAAFPKEASSKTPKACRVFESYECDLMDYAHQSYIDRPFRTYHIKAYDRVQLKLPRFYSFVSEGHTFYRLSSEDSIYISISVNCSSRGKAVPENERYVVSVVMHPAPGGSMNELSLIKLVTAFGSRQERYRAYGLGSVSDLIVKLPSGDEMPLSAFVSESLSSTMDGRLSGNVKLELCSNGAVELELSSVCGAESHDRTVKSYDAFFNSIASSSPEVTHVNKTLCGIVLGIFDFDRMNDAEIYDTVKPMVPRKSSFMVLCRGNLLKVRFDSDETERVDNIFISPYLLIPDVALSYNEMVLDTSSEKLAEIHSEIPYPPRQIYKYFPKIKEDGDKLKAVQDALTKQYIRNCFNYVSEQQIFLAGQEKRGLDSKYSDVENTIRFKSDEVESRKSRYSMFVDSIQNIALLVLALFQIFSIFENMHGLFYTTLTLAIVLGGIFAYQKLKQ